jgi:hypothetical protein
MAKCYGLFIFFILFNTITDDMICKFPLYELILYGNDVITDDCIKQIKNITLLENR